MSESDTKREQGVDFSSIEPLLEGISYPITTEELIAQHGDHTIERTNSNPITIRELFGEMGSETFEHVEELRQSMLNLMPEDSVGRKKYSDRGGSLPEETPAADREDQDLSM